MENQVVDLKANPYDLKLGQFTDFVMRDQEAELYRGKWNQQVFQREVPLHVEIGAGNGHFMATFCQDNPDVNFIGLDYRFKRGFKLAKKLSNLTQKNFRYLRAWGERLEFIFGESEVDQVYYFFPDPWPKTRHHKKRLFQAQYLNPLFRVIKPGGILFIKTDHDEYFRWMEKLIQQDQGRLFELLLRSEDLRSEFPGHFLSSFETQFEKLFIEQGIKIKALVLKSKKAHCL